MKKVMVILAASAALAGVSGCSASSIGGGNEQCIVLALGGNKLCGADAATWCRTTDSIRKSSGQDMSDSQMTCDSLESQYKDSGSGDGGY
jgi:uncharacterized membrane protein